jgi:truncated hemoglobin YjbI
MVKTGMLELLMVIVLLGGAGCASTPEEEKKKTDFFTSGNREADHRGSGQVTTGRKDKESRADGQKIAEEKTTLYERLGGEARIRLIVDDFIKRVLEDPRVNWSRTGVTTGGLFRRDRSVEWRRTPENVQKLKDHFVQFITLAAGGPAKYGGRPIKPLHSPMRISKAEFDASIGDLKATLDHLDVPNDVQKDLLSIFESTRPQIVPEK